MKRLASRLLPEDLLDTLEADLAWDYLACGALDRLLAGRLPGSTCTETDHNHPPSLWEARG